MCASMVLEDFFLLSKFVSFFFQTKEVRKNYGPAPEVKG